MKSSVVLSSSLSDHDVVAIVRKINCLRTKPRKILSRNFSKYCHESFQKDLNAVSWDGVLAQQDVNECWKLFKDCFLTVLNRNAPLVERTVKGRDLPWLDNEIKRAIHEREYHHRKAKQTGSEHHWSTYKRKRNAVTSMIRRKKANYHKALIQENKSNPQGFWKAIKKCLPDNKSCQQRPSSFNINSVATKDKKEIANGFNKFFASIAAKLRDDLPPCAPQDISVIKHQVNPQNRRFRFKPVTKSEVSKVLITLKRSKSPGIDNIPPGTVKDAAKVIIHPLLHIINLSLATSTIPRDWKIARCVPIFKSGNTKEFDNYRPISVLPVFSKILERVVHNQLYEYLENNKFLSSQQFGFRRNRSTSSAVVYFTDIVRKNMDRGQLTGALFIDLRKAFDTVDHSTLISKLPLYGIEHAEQRWIQNYLTQRSQIACFEGELSQEENISYGVPQGSILGPLFFLIHINDVHLYIKNCNTIMYADDTVLLFSEKTEAEIYRAINHDASLLHTWLCKNGLILNSNRGKTELMMFGTAAKRKKIEHDVIIEINSRPISNTDKYKYLGIHLDPSLSLTDHVQKVCKKASSRLGLLRRIRPILTIHAALDLYKTMVQPVTTYCSTAFLSMSETNRKKLERLETRATKIIFGARHQQHRMFRSFANMQNIQCADFVFRCLNKTAPDVFHEHFQKVDHQKATKGNGKNLKIPKVKTESAKRGFYFYGVKVYNALPTHLKTEKFYLPFKQGIKEHFMD